MRSKWKSIVAATSLVLAPQLAMADEVQDQLKVMQQRMSQLEDRLQATTDQLEATQKKADEQQELIQRSGIATSKSSSGLSAFLESVQVTGLVAAGYNYNFNNPDGSTPLTSANGLRAFDQDANSFSFDQMKIGLERPVNDDNRAGFKTSLYFGETARVLNGNPVTFNQSCFQSENINACGNNRHDTEIHVSDAYVQYYAPFGDLTVKAGKFQTWLGAEVIDADANYLISRSLLFQNAVPYEHLGATAQAKYDNGIDWGLGLVNGWDASNGADINSGKTIIARLGYTGDKWGAALNTLYGPEQFANSGNQRTVVDAVLNFNPTETFSAYIEGDMGWEGFKGVNTFDASNGTFNGQSDDFYWGIAAAGRLGLTEKLGLSLRGEYLRDAQSGSITTRADGLSNSYSSAWEGSLGLDYALTSQLKAKTEFRYDKVNNGDGSNRFFKSGDGRALQQNQQTVEAQLVYSF